MKIIFFDVYKRKVFRSLIKGKLVMCFSHEGLKKQKEEALKKELLLIFVSYDIIYKVFAINFGSNTRYMF